MLTMLIALSNPIWKMWPEALMIATAMVYMVGLKVLTRHGPSSSTYVRLLSSIGLISTASLLLLGITPNLYTIVAIPVIPAPFAFAALILRPERIEAWTKTRIYLAVCVAASALCWTIQVIWLSTR
jgi:hypothetical protein